MPAVKNRPGLLDHNAILADARDLSMAGFALNSRKRQEAPRFK